MVLRGEPGTPVAVGVARGADRLDFRLERAPVPTPTVEGFARGEDNAWHPWIAAPDGLAYVRIDAFREATEPDFDAMLEPHLDPLRGLILDLRGNPGGDVNAAVQIGDRFVKNGILAESRAGSTGHRARHRPGDRPQAHPLEPRRAGRLGGVPVVVLVDAETASAAEIAGLLQERAGAVVLGAPTWGRARPGPPCRARPGLRRAVQQLGLDPPQRSALSGGERRRGHPDLPESSAPPSASRPASTTRSGPPCGSTRTAPRCGGRIRSGGPSAPLSRPGAGPRGLTLRALIAAGGRLKDPGGPPARPRGPVATCRGDAGLQRRRDGRDGLGHGHLDALGGREVGMASAASRRSAGCSPRTSCPPAR